MTERWDSEARIKEMMSVLDDSSARSAEEEINVPHMLFLSGQKDQLVPPWHMHSLYSIIKEKALKVKGKIVRLENLPGDHVDTCLSPHYFKAIRRFINEICE